MSTMNCIRCILGAGLHAEDAFWSTRGSCKRDLGRRKF